MNIEMGPVYGPFVSELLDRGPEYNFPEISTEEANIFRLKALGYSREDVGAKSGQINFRVVHTIEGINKRLYTNTFGSIVQMIEKGLIDRERLVTDADFHFGMYSGLNPREQETLDLMGDCANRNDKDIAVKMHISPFTAKRHRIELLSKLQLNTMQARVFRYLLPPQYASEQSTSQAKNM